MRFTHLCVQLAVRVCSARVCTANRAFMHLSQKHALPPVPQDFAALAPGVQDAIAAFEQDGEQQLQCCTGHCTLCSRQLPVSRAALRCAMLCVLWPAAAQLAHPICVLGCCLHRNSVIDISIIVLFPSDYSGGGAAARIRESLHSSR